MSAWRWAWLVLLWSGCEQPPVRGEVHVDAGPQRWKNPNRWIDYRRPCVPWSGDAGACDAGTMIFDGTSCRLACDALDAGDPRAFEDELACVSTCQCDHSKFGPGDLTAERSCDWLYLFRDWSLPFDAGVCLPLQPMCSIWAAPPTGFGTPLGQSGLRLACEQSLRPVVTGIYCDVWSE